MGGKSLQRSSTGISMLMDHATVLTPQALLQLFTPPGMAGCCSCPSVVLWVPYLVVHVPCSLQLTPGDPRKKAPAWYPRAWAKHSTPAGWLMWGYQQLQDTQGVVAVSVQQQASALAGTLSQATVCVLLHRCFLWDRSNSLQYEHPAWHGSLLDGLHTSNTESSPLPVQS